MVALSVLLAIGAATVALRVTGRAMELSGRLRLLWFAAGGMAMGTGIWSMHFMGMLALSLPIAVTYHLPTVLFSWVIVVFSALIALIMVTGQGRLRLRLGAGSLVLGSGVAAMNYTGMAAMRMAAVIHYDPIFWWLSVICAVSISFAGLSVVFSRRDTGLRVVDGRLLLGAIVLGLAISATHYTGMAAASFLPDVTALPDTSHGIDVSLLGGVAVVAGTVLLLGTILAWPMHTSPRSYAWVPVFLILVIVATLVMAGVSIYYVKEQMVASTGKVLALRADFLADMMSRFIFERYGDSQVLAHSSIFLDRDRVKQSNYLNLFRSAYPVYQWLSVTDASGRIAVSTDQSRIGQDLSELESFRETRDHNNVFVSDSTLFEADGDKFSLTLASPIRGQQGEFLGMVMTRVIPAILSEILEKMVSQIELQAGSYGRVEFQLLRGDGLVLADSNHGEGGDVYLNRLGVRSAQAVSRAAPGKSNYVEELDARRQVPVITGYVKTSGYLTFPGLPWGILVRADLGDVMIPIRVVLWRLGIIGASVFIAIFSFQAWTILRLQRQWAQSYVIEQAIVASSNGIFIADPCASDHVLTYVNPAFERISGYSVQECLGRPCGFLHGADTEAHAVDKIDHALRDAQACRVEYKNYRKDGSLFWNDLALSPVREPDGQLTHFIGVVTDVTARKQAEEQARLVVEAAPTGLVMVDHEGTMLLVNAHMEQLFGYQREELAGQSIAMLLPERLRAQHQGHRLDFFASPRMRAMGAGPELFGLCKDGREIPIEVGLNPIETANGVIVMASIVDITDRKRMEGALRHTSAQLTALVESSPLAIMILDPDGLVQVWNPAAVRIFGWSAEEVLGGPIPIVPEEQWEEARLLRRRGFENNTVSNLEVVRQRKDGSLVEIAYSNAPLRNPDGTNYGIMGILEDITERKQAEFALHEQMQLASLTADVNGALVQNTDLRSMLQVSAEALVRHLDVAFARIWLLGPGDLCSTCYKAAHCLNQEQCLHLEASAGLYTNVNGEFRRVPLGELKIGKIAQGWGRMVTNDVLNDERLPNKAWMKENGLHAFAGYPLLMGGQIVGVMAVFARQSLTEPVQQALEAVSRILTLGITRKKAEEELCRSEAFMDSVLENLPNMVFVKAAADLRFVRFNKAGEHLLGHSRDALIGKNDYDLFPAEQADFFSANDRAVIESRQMRDILEEPIETRTLGRRLLHTKKVPIFDVEGIPQFLLGISEDITERKQAEDALRRSNAELEQFAYVVSHDLKAPLRGISSLANWLASDYGDALGTEGQEQLHLMIGRVKRMNALIEGILAYSRASRIREPEIAVDVTQVVQSTIDLLAPPPHIQIEVAAALPTVWCEPTRIAQVFQNLLSNAIKYMDKPAGRIGVSCVRQGGFWRFGIEDNGPGIEEQYFGKIFQLFQTLAARDKVEGTGVGLSIVQKIVELQGGRIWLESRVGEGTTFYFTVPASAGAQGMSSIGT